MCKVFLSNLLGILTTCNSKTFEKYNSPSAKWPKWQMEKNLENFQCTTGKTNTERCTCIAIKVIKGDVNCEDRDIRENAVELCVGYLKLVLPF
jgi:hypothetical protein